MFSVQSGMFRSILHYCHFGFVFIYERLAQISLKSCTFYLIWHFNLLKLFINPFLINSLQGKVSKLSNRLHLPILEKNLDQNVHYVIIYFDF